MKRIFRLALISFILSLSLSPPQLSADSKLTFPDSEPEISMDFQDAGLKDILKVFSIQSNLNFIASEGVQDRKITLYLDKVPLKMAMDKLFKANNLSYELDRDSNIFIVKDWGKLEVETITRVFYLKYATVSSSSLEQEVSSQIGTGTATGTSTGITDAVKNLLSKSGTVIEDSRTNSLIVTDTPNRMPVIAQVIASLDVRVSQVMLEVEMLDVSKNIVDKIGFKFGQTPFKVAITGATATSALGFPFQSWGKTFFTDSNRGTLTVNSDSYSAQLDFLRTQSDTKTLARPRILTLNNKTAEIKIVTNKSLNPQYTQQTTTAPSTTSVERMEVGISLRVTPQVNPDTGEVTMVIVPKVSDTIAGITVTATSTTSGYTAQDKDERTTKSIVRVKDGDTVVLGGLIRKEFSQTITKLPFFGDLPLVGALFRHKDNDTDRERELLVFITPHIIKDTDIKLAQTKKVTLPEREQNTASGFNREQAISSSLNSLEKKNNK